MGEGEGEGEINTSFDLPHFRFPLSPFPPETPDTQAKSALRSHFFYTACRTKINLQIPIHVKATNHIIYSKWTFTSMETLAQISAVFSGRETRGNGRHG